MSDSRQRTGANSEPSPFDQAEEIFSGLVKQLRDREFKILLDKYNEEFVTAKPTTELTDDDFEGIEQARAAEQLQRRCKYARDLSKDIMKRISGSPDSELFKTAKKVLDLLDEIEVGAENRWRELDTTTYTLVQLCRAGCKEPVETRGNSTLKSKIKDFLWTLYEKTLKVVVDAVMERMCPK
jgi:hypothetical protein